MKPNLFMKRKLEIGLYLINRDVCLLGDATMTWLRYAKVRAFPPNLNEPHCF